MISSIRFNSILVQLEDRRGPRSGSVQRGFNSILVQLEDIDADTVTVTVKRFNSILVQLEVGRVYLRFPDRNVSIPYWCN